MTTKTEEDQQEEDPGKGQLFCFFNETRPCGPDCMAYLTVPPQGKTYLGVQWAQCHILVNVDRAGRHLTVLTQHADTFVRATTGAKAPEVR